MNVRLNPHVSVDCVIFGFDGQSLKVLLIDRNYDIPPEKLTKPLTLKLPGSMVYDDEDVDTAATRVLKELTGLENIFLKQFHVFGSPDRLKKEEDLIWLQAETHMKIKRVVTIAYYSLIKIHKTTPSDGRVVWLDAMNLPELAFDHNNIIQVGLQTLQKEIQHEPIELFELLPKKFTIRQLQTLYELILGKKLDNRNFRKSVSRSGYIVPVNEKERNVAHKPAQYYRFSHSRYLKNQKL
ncbi:MAG: NUDIX domain-containing protein [Bacteroidales bacterium]|nr:NUDIX domain-containing protein [Bacteroidales bacterium]HOK98112.1 NUDIX domain-containing protein [Bacteroidales bacterium]HPO64864.1 NUDIX domain-containing protein [Bacteroidales bacterium]